VLNVLARAVRRLRVERVSTTRDGLLIHCDPADWLQAHIAYFGIWEPHVTGFIKQRLRGDDVFLDIGANIGYYSLLAAGLCRKVIAVEAGSANFGRLRDNIARNAVRNVVCLNVAVAAEDREFELFLGPDCNAGGATLVQSRARDRESSAVETVAGRRLEGILDARDLERIRLIKIDVEGAERPILEQIAALAPRWRPDLEIIVEVDPKSFAEAGGSLAEVIEAFKAIGFNAYRIQNSYLPLEYLGRPRLRPPVRLKQTPQTETDLVLSRVDAEVL
jgi:FkbM family methyltransferase